MSRPICKIVKHETPNGTFYIPHRYVYKTRLFRKSGYEWEAFWLMENYGTREFQKISIAYFEFEYRTQEMAEYVCQEYLRCTQSGEAIKIWSKDDDK